MEQFEVETLAAFGCDQLPQAVRAAGALVQYLRETQRATLPQLVSLRVYSTDEFMTLDQATRRNLELTQTIRGANEKGSLLGVLDATRTPMGSRLLRRWLHQPLLDLDKLTKRLDAVQSWHDDLPTRAELRTLLRQIGDLERWTNRAAQGIARPQELVGIRQAAGSCCQRSNALQNLRNCTTLHNCQLSIVNYARMSSTSCSAAIAEEPPATAGKRRCHPQGLFGRTGRHRRRQARCQGVGRQPGAQRTRAHRHQVAQGRLQQGLRLLHRSHHGQQPPRCRTDYIRKQTLVNAERYITPELKEYESLILNAEERQSSSRPRSIQAGVGVRLRAAAPRLLQLAQALAELDVTAALAEVAANNRFVRPELADDPTI